MHHTTITTLEESRTINFDTYFADNNFFIIQKNYVRQKIIGGEKLNCEQCFNYFGIGVYPNVAVDRRYTLYCTFKKNLNY